MRDGHMAKKKSKRETKEENGRESEREREEKKNSLLSKIYGNQTLGFLWSKSQS